jgi:hypothetical protein
MPGINVKEDGISKKPIGKTNMGRKRKHQDDKQEPNSKLPIGSFESYISSRVVFDKDKFESALIALSKCKDALCDPLFRRTSLKFYVCTACRDHWLCLNEMV